MADPMGCDCGGCLPRCLAQAHAEGRAEGLEEAARAVLEDCRDNVAAYTTPANAARVIRSLAAGVAGQPSGDAK